MGRQEHFATAVRPNTFAYARSLPQDQMRKLCAQCDSITAEHEQE